MESLRIGVQAAWPLGWPSHEVAMHELAAAVYSGNTGMVHALVARGVPLNSAPRGMRPPLVAAAAAGALAIVNELLRAGADVNVADAHGWTALIAATRHDRIPVMRRLLASGAYPDAQTNAGDAAMHFAAARDNVPAAAVLDRAGALVDIANTAGITPLFVACNKDYMRVVTELLRQGANPFLQNNHGETPIMIAAVRNAEILHTLLDYTVGDTDEDEATTVAMLNVQDATGRTALIHAALQGRSDSVELLLAYGADPDVLDNHDKTALDYATDPTVRRMLRPASY